MSAPFTDPNVAKAIDRLTEMLGRFLAPVGSIDRSLATIARGFAPQPSEPSDVTIDVIPKETESGS